MRTLIALLSLLMIANQSIAQDKDPKAKAVLDEVSKKIKSYTSFSVEFSFNLKTADKIDETQKGTALIKGKSYIIDMGNQKLLCDGKTVWTILKDEKEVYPNPIEPGDKDDDLFDPSNLFTLWEKDFKYRWVKEETVEGVVLVEISMVPLNPAKSKYHTIIVKVNKAKSELHTVIVKGKDGETLTYKLTKMVANPPVNDADFKYSPAKYPGYTVID